MGKYSEHLNDRVNDKQTEITRYVNKDENIEFFIRDAITFNAANQLLKAGFRNTTLVDPNTELLIRVLARDLPLQ